MHSPLPDLSLNGFPAPAAIGTFSKCGYSCRGEARSGLFAKESRRYPPDRRDATSSVRIAVRASSRGEARHRTRVAIEQDLLRHGSAIAHPTGLSPRESGVAVISAGQCAIRGILRNYGRTTGPRSATLPTIADTVTTRDARAPGAGQHATAVPATQHPAISPQAERNRRFCRSDYSQAGSGNCQRARTWPRAAPLRSPR
jgi:hypothetical protein